jgi:hypothetical protein
VVNREFVAAEDSMCTSENVLGVGEGKGASPSVISLCTGVDVASTGPSAAQTM